MNRFRVVNLRFIVGFFLLGDGLVWVVGRGGIKLKIFFLNFV